MKIYIDESGLFGAYKDVDKVGKAGKAWCVVGAMSVPHFREKQMLTALRELKQDMGVNPSEEIKNPRPSPDSPEFVKFANKLKEANCTLHAVTTNRFLLSDQETMDHKKTELMEWKGISKSKGRGWMISTSCL